MLIDDVGHENAPLSNRYTCFFLAYAELVGLLTLPSLIKSSADIAQSDQTVDCTRFDTLWRCRSRDMLRMFSKRMSAEGFSYNNSLDVVADYKDLPSGKLY